jgi:hypothetical protein
MGDIASQIAGYSGPLQQTLGDTARYQANNALNAVGSNFANQGALFSGAAGQAMGEALANPFAQAQAQTQQAQLGAAGGAMQQLLGSQGQVTSSLLGAQSGLGSSMLGALGGLGQSQMGATGGLGSSLIGSTGSALDNTLSSSVNAYGQALGAGSNLMENTSGLVAPTTMVNPEWAAQNQLIQNAQAARQAQAAGKSNQISQMASPMNLVSPGKS